MSSKVPVSIALEEAWLGAVDEVRAELTAKGFEPHEVLREVGILLGVARRAQLDELRAVRGVAAVELVGQVSVSSNEPE